MSEVAKRSEIVLKIGVDENNVPLEINWSADDGGISESETKAFLLSVWDPKEVNTMRIDLWTKEMKVDEMKQFFHQTLITMADTFERATGEDKICGDMRDFCDYFAEKMNIKAPE